jgi:hypothetical protein
MKYQVMQADELYNVKIIFFILAALEVAINV